MTPNELIAGMEQLVADMTALIARYRAEEVVVPVVVVPVVHVVPAGGDLQAALDAGHQNVALQEGTYSGVTISKPVSIAGNGATIVGADAAAIRVAPGTTDVFLSDLFCAASWRGPVVQLGDNSATTQNTVDRVPRRIQLERVVVPTHRGKRGFEINAADVKLLDCVARDVWDPQLADSQGVGILNTPGPVSIIGGFYESGSENIMIGGDSLKIPGIVQSDILIEGVNLYKPESWRTDGVNRAVKNLLEMKAGKGVTVRNCNLSGSWKAAQDGWGIVITPKNSNYIEDVTLENLTVERVGGGIQFLGRDYNTVTPQLTKGVTVRDCKFSINKATYGGRGILALYIDGMQDATWERVTAALDGSAIVTCDTKIPAGPFTMRSCTMNTGQYAVLAPGVNFGGPTPPTHAGRELITVFEGNTFSGAPSQFKTLYPDNVYE